METLRQFTDRKARELKRRADAAYSTLGKATPVLRDLRSAAGGQVAAAASQLDHNPAARVVASELALEAGRVAGAGRGAWNMLGDAVEAEDFYQRLQNPAPDILNGRDTPADEMLQAGQGAVGYIKSRASNTRALADDLRSAFHHANVSLNPTASPQADTVIGEVGRIFPVGMTQGELAFDVAAPTKGVPAIRALTGARRLSRAARLAQYAKEGLSPGLIAYFEELYTGLGHHFLPQRTRLPAMLGGGPLPRIISDGPFNMLKPSGMTRGEFYRLHHGVDPHYQGGRVPKRYGGGGWSGKRLGWDKYDQLGRIWYGSPGPLKATVGGGAAAATAVAANEESER